MHESMMAQIGMEHEHHASHDNNYGTNDGWVDISHSYNSSQHQSPMYEHPGFQFMQPLQHNGNEQSYNPPRMPQPPPPHTTHQQLLPLIMPGNPTWPSLLTNPASYSAPPVAIPPISAPVVKGNGAKLPAIHATPSPRKTLTDNDRRRMCQYHEENPSVKQTEIGAMFGVERSTVSKVLRQREKYLFPEDRSLSPVKRTHWLRTQLEVQLRKLQMGFLQHHRVACPLPRHYQQTRVTKTLDPRTQTGTLARRTMDTGIRTLKVPRPCQVLSRTTIRLHFRVDPLAPDSAGGSTSQTPNGISPTSPSGLPSPSPLSANKSDEDLRSENSNGYFGQENNGYRHSNSQSTTSLSSAFTDNNPSSFSGGPTSPTGPFAFSPDSSGWLPSQQSRLPPPGNGFQRPRSQTFPMLGIDPSFISSQSNEPLTPKYNMPVTAPSSALDSPIHEMGPPFGMDSAISSPPLHHSSSNGSMAPPSTGTPITGLQSPPGSSAPSSPTQDDARRALDLVLSFFNQAPNGLVDQNEYMTVLKLTEKLRLTTPLPGGLHRIAEQDCELQAPKMEQSMSAGC
ncbi:uncharacterized protein PAC_16003 [Phialocephala subalpina]|uniref:HTH psq-type domain-containing protein n=1 Tax=Phialocephala subalpina TaxID=576137 RepID=A0A1L7XM39_9HELO|nr:uncharacterized protein PAC_16003 [Phialocephala subalpina]